MKKIFLLINLLFFITSVFGMKNDESKNNQKLKRKNIRLLKSGVKRGSVKIVFFKKIFNILTCTGCDNIKILDK